LDDAKLLCYPTEERADNAVTVSQTDESGRFVLRTNGEVDGAYPGTYKVVVVKSKVTGTRKDPETGDDLPVYGLATPQKYSLQNTTDLVITVPPNAGSPNDGS
jgi:hypothetical protein